MTPSDSTTAIEPNAAPELQRRGFGIFAKWAALIAGVVGIAVALLTTYFPSRQFRESEVLLEQRALTYAHIASREVRSAVAFSDRETAREVFQAVAQDPLVLGLGLYANGEIIEETGKLTAVARLAGRSLHEEKSYKLPDRLLVVSEVRSLEGPRGTLVLELSRAGLEQTRRELQRTALMAGAGTLGLALLLALLVARSMAVRVRVIAAAATSVAGGNLVHAPVGDDSGDEIGVLGRAFDAMVRQLNAFVASMRRQAQEEQERLEHLVQERTLELEERNQALRLVMDNVDQGFLTIDRAGKLSEERSRRVDVWFGTPTGHATIWSYFDQIVPGLGQRLELGFSQVVDGLLPIEIALEQLPKRFSLRERHYSIAFNPVCSAGRDEFERAIVVISDVTDLVKRERLECEEKETATVVLKLLADPEQLRSFLAEARMLVRTISERREEAQFVRTVHTLKGNSSLCGFEMLASACHSLEDRLAEGEPWRAVSLSALEDEFARVEAKLEQLLTGFSGSGLMIDDRDRSDLLEAIRRAAPHSELEAIVQSWSHERLDLRLERAADQVRDLARRLGKGPIDVHVQSERMRMGMQLVPFFQEIGHVLRNVVDHGVESPEERRLAGKSDPCPVHLRAFCGPSSVVVEIEDSGRGIAWERVREKARRLGLVTSDEVDRSVLARFLFTDGLSTAEQVTQTSGRGVGLSAVHEAVSRHGGHIEVVSEPGAGTKFSFVWPRRASRQKERASLDI